MPREQVPPRCRVLSPLCGWALVRTESPEEQTGFELSVPLARHLLKSTTVFFERRCRPLLRPSQSSRFSAGRGLIESVEELRGGDSVIPGQAVACACSVAVGVA